MDSKYNKLDSTLDDIAMRNNSNRYPRKRNFRGGRGNFGQRRNPGYNFENRRFRQNNNNFFNGMGRRDRGGDRRRFPQRFGLQNRRRYNFRQGNSFGRNRVCNSFSFIDFFVSLVNYNINPIKIYLLRNFYIYFYYF